MEYNPDVHGIECPKCGHGMDEISYGGDLVIDRCTHCQGLWFDEGEAEILKNKWMGDALDTGHPAEGKKWDAVDEIACPRCGKDMEKASDPTNHTFGMKSADNMACSWMLGNLPTTSMKPWQIGFAVGSKALAKNSKQPSWPGAQKRPAAPIKLNHDT